jgi:hypothetical protein
VRKRRRESEREEERKREREGERERGKRPKTQSLCSSEGSFVKAKQSEIREIKKASEPISASFPLLKSFFLPLKITQRFFWWRELGCCLLLTPLALLSHAAA